MAQEKKRYHWLKLKEDFFKDEVIEWLEEQTNGKDYVLFYLKLCCKSLRNDGTLIRQVGNKDVPYNIEKLAEIGKTSVDTAAVALKVLQEIGLIEVQDGGELYLTQLQTMVGSESATPAAIKKRAYRNKLKTIKALPQRDNGEDTDKDYNEDNKGDIKGTNCPTEYRDKSIEKEKDIPNGISKKKARDDELLEKQFSEFWEHYPRKVGRKTAKRAFEKAIQKVSLGALVDAVEQQKCGNQWTRDNGEFIPHPTTWLNGERWLDVVELGEIKHETNGRIAQKVSGAPEWLGDDLI